MQCNHPQHVFIPFVPAHLVAYCCVPAPMIVGIQDRLLDTLLAQHIGEVRVVLFVTRRRPVSTLFPTPHALVRTRSCYCVGDWDPFRFFHFTPMLFLPTCVCPLACSPGVDCVSRHRRGGCHKSCHWRSSARRRHRCALQGCDPASSSHPRGGPCVDGRSYRRHGTGSVASAQWVPHAWLNVSTRRVGWLGTSALVRGCGVFPRLAATTRGQECSDLPQALVDSWAACRRIQSPWPTHRCGGT